MFKKKRYYHIKSIENNKEYDRDGWGYYYTYVPITNAVAFLNEAVAEFNSDYKKEKLWIKINCVEDKQNAYFTLIGKERDISKFMNDILTISRFVNHYAIRPAYRCDVEPI